MSIFFTNLNNFIQKFSSIENKELNGDVHTDFILINKMLDSNNQTTAV